MAQDWQQWQGKQVEVRGWITKRRENRSRKGKTKSAYAFKLLTMNVLAEDVATVKADNSSSRRIRRPLLEVIPRW